MGYTSGWHSLAALKHYILQSYKSSQHLELLDHKSTKYGRHLWIAVKYKDSPRSFIALYLISKHGSQWGYKDMSEDMGPCYYDCPLSLLDKTTGDPNSQYGSSWRQEVRTYHANIKSNNEILPGEVVECYGKKYLIVGKVKRTLRGKSLENGVIYRIPPKAIVRLSNSESFILGD